MREETRRRICQAAEEMNYKPSLVAAGLRGQKTNTIGVIVPDIGTTVFSAVVREVEKLAGSRDCNLILCTTGALIENERKYAEMLMRRRVEGVIAIPFGARVNHDCSHLLDLRRGGIPVVLAEQNMPGTGLPLVVTDNFSGARELTSHLISLGHRRIAFMVNSLEAWNYAGLERFNGYREALADNGIRMDRNLILDTGDESFESLMVLLRQDNPPTALFALCDGVAISMISHLHRNGIAVPRDFSVAGFDNIDIAASYIPGLTTVDQPMRELGKRAAEILFDIIDGNIDMKKERIYERIPCGLVVRESCSQNIKEK